jgi:hypothetical protein
VTESTGNVERTGLFDGTGARRVLFARLHRNADGFPEWFVLACAVKSAVRDEGGSGGGSGRHQSRRAEPFLKRWQDTMNHWASRNGGILRDHSVYRGCGLDLAPGWTPLGERVLVSPARPARPAALSVLGRLELPAGFYLGSRSTL